MRSREPFGRLPGEPLGDRLRVLEAPVDSSNAGVPLRRAVPGCLLLEMAEDVAVATCGSTGTSKRAEGGDSQAGVGKVPNLPGPSALPRSLCVRPTLETEAESAAAGCSVLTSRQEDPKWD
jgi:hypothetical protein